MRVQGRISSFNWSRFERWFLPFRNSGADGTGSRRWRPLRRARQALAHLERFFGAGRRAIDITRHPVNAGFERRLAQGAARGTVTYEVRILIAAISVPWRTGSLRYGRSSSCLHCFRRSWARACRKAGLEGRLVHDLRRTAARDFRRRGVSEGEIMRLCGWKTRAMFDRYNIIDEADLAQAVAKRFNGKTTANTATPTTPPGSLSSSPV